MPCALTSTDRASSTAWPAPQGELSLIEQLLPEELLLLIFERLPIVSLAAAQCVCHAWRRVGGAQPLWRAACRDAFFSTPMEHNAALVRQLYRGDWKRMLLQRPHLRFDGVYVSRNTYLRTGVVEWTVKNAVRRLLLQMLGGGLGGGEGEGGCQVVCVSTCYGWGATLCRVG
jgi:hypothetical protein